MNIYDFKVNDIDGNEVSMEQFKKFLRESKLKYIGRRYVPFLIKVKNWLKI